MKWYGSRAELVDGERWEKFRTEKVNTYPAAVVHRAGSSCNWAVYGRNGGDRIAEGKHADLTQAQIEAEKALKKWMAENE